MRYEFAPDLQKIAEDICQILFPYINVNRVKCFRSYGSSSKRTIARCHSINKIMQKALGIQAFYPLEFISENFDKLSNDKKTKIIIHELMHIPKSFGGGFRHHNVVCDKNINQCYNIYNSKKEEKRKWF